MSDVSKIAIIGCRNADPNLVCQCLESSWDRQEFNFTGGVEIVTGDANGADLAARAFAANHNLPLVVFAAKWDVHGKSAGPMRNSEIVEYAEWCIAFWDGESRGTLDTITKMTRAGKFVQIFSLKNLREVRGQEMIDGEMQ
jgi:hypothetical protein